MRDSLQTDLETPKTVNHWSRFIDRIHVPRHPYAPSPLRRVFCLTFLAILANSAVADNWPSFRNGGTSVVESEAPPIRWSPDHGIAWQVAIPGYGQSSPVVWNGTVYLTSSDGPWQTRQFVHSYELESGKHCWSREVSGSTKFENYFRNSRAAPTCVVDEHCIVSFFATGDVTAMDHQGEVLWTVALFDRFGMPVNERGTASSPCQTDDHVILVIDHSGPSYIVAINKSDGSIAWKTERGHRVPSWSSPVATTVANHDLIVISSADTIEAYDANNGAMLWQRSGLAGNHIPSATVVDGSVYTGSTQMFHSSASEEAIAGSNCKIDMGDLSESNAPTVVWSAERANSYYSSPLVFGGYVYYVNKSGVLYCVDAETGERCFAKRIGNPCWASAIGVTDDAGNQLIYFVTKNGFTVVLRPAPEYDQIARNQLWDAEAMVQAREEAKKSRESNRLPAEEAPEKTGPEKMLAGMPEKALHQLFSYDDPAVYGVAFAQDRLLIRTGQRLYCIGTKQ
ncbi:outer membrane biogenesis protein BamB [Stieleria maiorica]|uniref:Outer membrane biogenesis protein BamB n=2 Tax=Stieleria maiorica TaxID=2795974 RepID=A0A5B9M9B7_9BACT|nr:outer membrane biogenesis protein BamB [Stieleria maiorica]